MADYDERLKEMHYVYKVDLLDFVENKYHETYIPAYDFECASKQAIELVDQDSIIVGIKRLGHMKYRDSGIAGSGKMALIRIPNLAKIGQTYVVAAG